ncbi:DUF2726 domain-containing protein [Breoghania sp.]|uniref:DUF2726 domain-containing protein n=1 Tax=Breoghania sp. TaxID=2065378 RepID=UPI002AA86316|nr:DUF2726 domain-containing protein [Breoghania sp.]
MSFEMFVGIVFGGIISLVWGKIQQMRRRQIQKQYDLSDPANQLRFVEQVGLYPRRPINKEAYYKAFVPIEKCLKKDWKGYRLLAEVGLGAFVGTDEQNAHKSACDRAFKSYNSKRVDFLVIDRKGNPAVAIEYHGSGHYLSEDAIARDIVKKCVLERAGIELLEVYPFSDPHETEADFRSVIERYLER